MTPSKGYPPGTPRARVPGSPRATARRAIASHPATRRRALLLRRGTWAAVGLLGARVLPGRWEAWEPPGGPPLAAFRAGWTAVLGRHDDVIAFPRAQHGRLGFSALLLRRGDAWCFVRVSPPGDARPAREDAALRAMAAHPPAGLAVPRPLGTGVTEAWPWVATTAVLTPFHRPVLRVETAAALLPPLQQVLAHAAPPPPGRESWVPVHGDLAPWNLRRVAGDTLALVDWEQVGWGPPGADLVHFAAASAVVRNRPPARLDAPEAVEHWLARVRERLHGSGDAAYDAALIGALERMRMDAG